MHYHYPLTTSFPDENLLKDFVKNAERKFQAKHTSLEQLLTYASASMNWTADFLLDPGVKWQKVHLPINKLYLTGTIPSWNKVIIDECERSPEKLRARFQSDPAMEKLFEKAVWSSLAILVRYEEDQYKVFDGMHRAIAAIREGKETIEAYVAYMPEKFQTVCEPHVVYDVLKAYIRKLNTDREGLITTLRYLRKSFVNVDELLKKRFDESGIADEEIQKIIREALE